MSTATALALVTEQDDPFTKQQRELIKRQIAPGIDDGNLMLFGMVCQRTGLDPFLKQIYTIKRGDKWTIQTGIDGYRLLAARTGQLAGIDDPIYDTESEANPGKASVTVWRLVAGQRCPFTATARWSEYKPPTDPAGTWKRMPFLMLGKCAESLALRKAFPAELSGVYTTEEMAQADAPAVVEAVTEAAPTTARQLADYAKRHGIPPKMIQAGLKKYGGDIERTYEAMRRYVNERDSTPPREHDEDGITFETEDASLEGLEVGGKN